MVDVTSDQFRKTVKMSAFCLPTTGLCCLDLKCLVTSILPEYRKCVCLAKQVSWELLLPRCQSEPACILSYVSLTLGSGLAVQASSGLCQALRSFFL